MLKNIFAALAVTVFGGLLFLVPATASAQFSGDATGTGAGGVSEAVCHSSSKLDIPNEVDTVGTGTAACAATAANTNTRFNTIVRTIVNLFSLIVGIIAVIMIVYGGFKYITSGGDSGNVTGAKNTILYAIIGLVIVALAQFIVRFVLGKSADVTTS